MSIIVKHRTDIDLVAERVGVAARRASRSSPRKPAALTAAPGPRPADRRLLRGAARRGRRGRDRRDPRRVRGARGRPLDRAGGLPRGARGDDRQVAGGPPRLRAALRPLLLPRRRGGGARARDPRGPTATRAASASTSTSCARRSARRSPRATTARCATLARLAIAAFGRQGEGSGVVGVDVQRIRRTLGLQAGGARSHEDGEPRARPRADPARSSATCAASSSAR